MKKIFAAIITLMLPAILFAQPMDTATVYFENFDGANPQVTTTSIFDATAGDWKTDATLKVSVPNSFHSPVYTHSGASTVYLATIDLTSTNMTDQVRKFYLEFDHICKVDKLDEAYIYFSKASGLDFTGQPNWGNPVKLTFNQTSACYLSAGTMNPGGTVNTGAADFTQAGLGSGQFAASWYPSGTGNWQPNTLNANPAANWWRHEKFDLSSFVLDGTTKYVRLEFRVNKSSPSTSNTEQCKGWYLDNVHVLLSNCELIPPTITLTNPIYHNVGTNFNNNIGPYTIHATLKDNDTIDLTKLRFTYQICPFQAAAGPVVTVPNTITSNNLSSSGHTVLAEWELPTICYKDTIHYHIYMEDVHGSVAKKDDFLVAHHTYTNIQNNDCALDSLDKGTWPHCFTTGTAHPVKLYFKNRSDADHSVQTGSSYQTGLSVGLEVRNEAGQVTHNTTHNWTGSLCFDERDTLNLGTFVPTHGWNHIKVFVKTRNGAADGYHQNDTLKISWYSCDSLLKGDYTVGGSNPDFVNIREVRDNLEYCELGGPVRFHLRPGTYQDFYFRQKYAGQSDVNTITFIGDNRDNVIVTANVPDTSATIYQGAVTLINVANLHFQNITFQGRQQAASRAVVLRGNGSRDITFDNCKMVAYPTNSTVTTSYAVGRETSATTTPDTVIFRNCIMDGGNFGVYYVGNTQSGNNRRQNSLTIENCRIKSCYRGIYSKYSMPLVARNNHISQYPMGSHQEFSGMYVENIVSCDIDGNTVDSVFNAEYGIAAKNLTTKDYFIRNNHVKVGESLFGIYVGSSSSTAVDTGFIYNNEVILYPVTAGTSYAMQLDNSNALKVAHNSLYVKSDAPYSNTAALHIKNTTNNNITYLNNNMLVNECNSNDNTNFALYLNGTSKVVGGYNDLYSSSSAIAYTTVARNSISEFEGAMTTCTHNISLLPPMANATNSLLPTDFTGMECRRMPLVMQDIRGQQRSALTYMGAYANQIAATDASIVALLVPALGDCPQNSYNITVSVANKGSEVLNFANHHAVITLHSDSLNLTQTKNVTSGTVPVLGSSSQVVANNISIPVNQTVDLTFVIRTAGDNNYLNDTMRTSFIMEAARPDYEEDFSSGTKQTWTISQLSGAGNWTFIDGAGVNPVIAPVYGTGRLYFNSKTFSANTRSRAVMPVVQLDTMHPILEMWMAHDNVSNKPKEGVVVKVSTNGGLTYTALRPLTANGTPSTNPADTLVKRYNTSYATPDWALYTYDLNNYKNAGCIYIAFDGYAQQGNNINIDRIRLRNLYDNDIAVTQIYSQGETPTKYAMRDVYSALVRNEGSDTQSNIKVYLTVAGAAETYRDTVTIPTLGNNQQTLVTFPDHEMLVNEVKNVEIRSRNDQNNANNALNWRVVTNNNTANYADTTTAVMKTGDYNTVIRPCVRYKTNEELVVTDVKYYYDQSYITNRERGFKAFVANAAGEIITTSDVISFDSLQQNAWNILPIRNFALTNMTGEFYVGLEMTAPGDYLTYQVETPLRDSTFYYLENNGTYTPQTLGRFMIGAVVDTPHVHDFAILNMTNPTSRCDLGHEHITLTVTNNGSQAILPGTQLHYSINGLPAVTETMTDTLGSHETKPFVFNTIYDFTNHQINIDDNYNIIVWVTKDSRDRLQYNDTIRELVVSRGKSQMPVAPDTVDISYYTSGVLTASLPASIPQGVIAWYNSSGYEQWNFLTYANSFQTPTIFFDTTFFVTANPGYIYDKIVGTGKGTPTSPNTLNPDDKPFVFASGYSRGRMIYTQNDIGQYGPVARIGLYVTTKATGTNGIPIKLYLKETPLNTLPNDAYDWNNELLDATLVVDDMIFFGDTGWHYFNLSTPFNYTTGNLMLLTETNCNDHCSSCNNCGTAVSGTTVYPKFQATAQPGCVQYKNGNTTALTGTWGTPYGKRLNLAIRIADLQCGSEKHQIYVRVPDIPIYDVETIGLDHPQVTQTTPYPSHCALYDEHVRVIVRNNLNITIPANKVMVHARFNNQEITQLITHPLGPTQVDTVVFDTTFDFATHNHQDVTWNCVVYTDMPTESTVYRGNDTIRGTFISKRTAQFPRYPIVYYGNYTEPYTVIEPADRPVLANGNTEITQWRYYADSTTTTALTPLPTTANPTYTTGPLYDTVVLYVEAKTQTSNCMTRRTPIIINVQVPQYDLETRHLVSPKSFQCNISANQPVVVSVRNTDTTSSSTIPANTFNVTGRFADGAYVVTDTKPLTTPVPHLDTATVTLNVANMSSTTVNRSYNYSIYSKPINNNMWVYKGNDTIHGMLYVPAKPVAPANIGPQSVPYGSTYTVSPTGMSHYYFYHNQNDAVPFAQGSSFTTDPIFSSQTYYYSGRIEDPAFKATITAGTGNTTNSAPFNMLSTRGKSYAQILYRQAEIGGVAGTIDSIYVKVNTANTTGIGIPIRMWLANAAATQTALTTAPTLTSWTTLTNNAQLVFDGDLAFNQLGWVAIPVQGRFDYTGGALMMYVEHDCGDNSCVTNLGVVEPKFANTSYANNNTERRIYQLAAATGTAFTGGGNRWSTQFLFNYTCQSPKASIIINTQVPQHDVGVIGINTPTSPSQYTANETVSVSVKNFGSTAASNFPVSYRLANGTPVTENYSGSLAAGATGTKTFTAHADLTAAYMDAQFCAYTGLNGDALHSNDTFCMTLNVGDPCISRSNQAAGLDISNVTVSTINNGQGTPFTNYTAEGDGMYTDYTATVPAGELIQGQTYPMSITHSFTASASGSIYKTVYVDWNRNGTFESNEKVTTQGPIASTAANATTSFNFDVPTTSSVGLTRMRVICVAANFTNACTPYSYAGETEDYAVNIVPPKPIDLGVSEIIHPVGNVCMDTAATMKVLLRNFGSETQYFTPGNAATVTVTITGANAGTYTATVDAGSVAPNNTYSVSIPHVNLSSLGSFNVSATVSYPGDQFALNNTKSATANTNVLGPIVSNINEFEDNFDQNTGMTDLHFDYSRWVAPTGSDTANYIWVINSKNSPNAGANYGPAHDHTQINTLQADYGRYAMVEGKNGTVNYSKWTAATTKCLNMHRQTQYPIELVFYKYFYAPVAATTANTSFNLTIEAGSGNDFVLVDTLSFANNRNVSPNWERFVTTIRNFNAVGQLRFKLTNHKNRIDPAIDDIYLGPGYPDLEVVNFIHPTDGVNSNCLIMGDSVHPTITLRNNGYSPLEEFDLRYVMSVGTKFDTLYEHVVQHIDADDTIHYTSKKGFLVHYNFKPLSFRVDCFVDLDKNTDNDYMTVVTCTNSGVDDYAEENGVGLKQNEPNPAFDHTRISFVLPEDGAANISIYSTLGQQLYSQDQSGTKGQNYMDVNTSNWAAGVYYYTLSFKDTSITKKMVIQK
jgi:hypothetical protein